MSGSIGPGEATLLIAANPRDEFGKQCLLPQYNGPGLKPVSTIDLSHFYRAYSQSRQGISLAFQDVSHLVEEDTIHGTLYLQSLSEACDVYFYLQGMDFGNDPQMLAALRLGLRFTTEGGVRSYIFELNEAGNTEGAVAMQTTAQGKMHFICSNHIQAQTNQTWLVYSIAFEYYLSAVKWCKRKIKTAKLDGDFAVFSYPECILISCGLHANN